MSKSILKIFEVTLHQFFFGGPPSFALKIKTHLTDEEKFFLYRFALTLPSQCCALEVGSYLGASACIVASAICKKGGKLHCVDTWKNEAMDEPQRDTWNEFIYNINPLKENIVPHRGLSINIARSFPAFIDFLLIDGDHGEEAVDGDLSVWLPKMKPNGIVALHDIGWAEGVQIGFKKHLIHQIAWQKSLPNLVICGLSNHTSNTEMEL